MTTNHQHNSYECQFKYSQGSILLDSLLGAGFLLGSILLKILVQSWVFLFISAAGFFLFWQAVKRAKYQGAQVKIGYTGIWTKKTGHVTWSKAKAVIKTETGTRTVVTYLIITNRQNQHQELARFDIAHLDADARIVQAYLRKFSPVSDKKSGT